MKATKINNKKQQQNNTNNNKQYNQQRNQQDIYKNNENKTTKSIDHAYNKIAKPKSLKKHEVTYDALLGLRWGSFWIYLHLFCAWGF